MPSRANSRALQPTFHELAEIESAKDQIREHLNAAEKLFKALGHQVDGIETRGLKLKRVPQDKLIEELLRRVQPREA